jgi:hypothetical protein
MTKGEAGKVGSQEAQSKKSWRQALRGWSLEFGDRKDRGLEGEKKGGSKLKAQSDKTMVV